MDCRRLLKLLLILTILAGLTVPGTAHEPNGFSVVLLPDTQLYSEKFPENYLAQTEWIRDRACKDRTRLVIHLGDIVQNPTVEKEWIVADRAHRLLDGVVPYSVLPGNHDGAPGDTTLYNKYFPPRRFDRYPWYGGHMGRTNDNNYSLFCAARMKFMVICLQYHPTDEVLDWAAGIVEQHADRRVIVATHDYMGPKKRRPIGDKIFNQLVRKHESIFMVVCGHVGAAAQLISVNDAGGQVHEVLCDYQNLPHGGDGWLQILRFSPDENRIRIEAHSAILPVGPDNPKALCTLDYDMSRREPVPTKRYRFPRLRRLMKKRSLVRSRR